MEQVCARRYELLSEICGALGALKQGSDEVWLAFPVQSVGSMMIAIPNLTTSILNWGS